MPYTIAVVAPESAFRLSLRFMLESEGYRVRLLDGLDELSRLAGATQGVMVDCIVVDHQILEERHIPVAEILEKGCPVILLANAPDVVPQHAWLRIVEKPLLGGAVVRAVQELLHDERRAHAT